MRAIASSYPASDGAIESLHGKGWCVVTNNDGLILVYRGHTMLDESGCLSSVEVTRLWFVAHGVEYTREYRGIKNDRAVRQAVRAIVREARKGGTS